MKKWLIRIAVGFGAIVVGLVVVYYAVSYLMVPSEITLRYWIKDATRVVVRPKGLYQQVSEPSTTLFVLDDPKALKELAENIHIQPAQVGLISRCACSGNPTLEFYRGSRLLTQVSLHHGQKLRWNGWYADGNLTESSSLYLIALLKSHGLTKDDFQ